MKLREEELDRALDEALAEIRDGALDPSFVTAASDRVWKRLEQLDAPRRIESCEDFRALLPAHRRGALDEPRRLLLEDHLGECVACRRAARNLERLRPVATSAGPGDRARSWLATVGWRAAAAAVIFLAVVGVSFQTELLSFETGGMVHVEAVDGELFHLKGDTSLPLHPGDVLKLEPGDEVRTAMGSTAMLALDDDSKVEMRERSELAVKQRKSLVPGRRTDGVIDLGRGSVIVEASDQGSGHLFLRTSDCRVAVTGTVFSVNRGVKGSRISVIEGEVHVDHSGTSDVLRAGEQATTGTALDKVPLEQEIAWSQNSQRYVELLQEVRALGQEIDEAFQPGLRYSTTLLDLAPAGSVVYFAMPNLSEELGRAYEILQERLASNPALREWWDKQAFPAGAGFNPPQHIQQIIDRIGAYGEQLGEEIAMVVVRGADRHPGLLFLAELQNPTAFTAMLSDEIARLEPAGVPRLQLIEGPLPARPPAPEGSSPELLFWNTGKFLAVAPRFAELRALDAVLHGQAGAALGGGAFYERLAGAYGRGVEWVAGVDLEHQIEGLNGAQHTALERLGVLDAQHLIGERQQRDGMTENRVVLTFNQPRRRLAAWLAEPGPLGAMDYIGPDASLAAAFVTKDMQGLVDDLFQFIGSTDSGFSGRLAEFEREHGIDIREDFAAPLGREFAMALDGPVLPTPSWKFVMEVYDPARLEQTIERVVEQANLEVASHGLKGLRLEREQVAGREFFRLESLDTGLAAHYVFDDGYVVCGASRALVERALQNRAAGITLAGSPAFTALLPRDGEINFSGVLYHHLGPLLDPLSGTFSAVGGANDGQRALLHKLAEESRPSLALIYGEPDRIVALSRSEGGLIGSSLSSLSGFGGLLGMQQSLVRSIEEQQRSHRE